MNQIATTQNSGLLKNYYVDKAEGSDVMLEALKRKREALAKTRIGLDQLEEEKETNQR